MNDISGSLKDFYVSTQLCKPLGVKLPVMSCNYHRPLRAGNPEADFIQAVLLKRGNKFSYSNTFWKIAPVVMVGVVAFGITAQVTRFLT